MSFEIKSSSPSSSSSSSSCSSYPLLSHTFCFSDQTPCFESRMGSRSISILVIYFTTLIGFQVRKSIEWYDWWKMDWKECERTRSWSTEAIFQNPWETSVMVAGELADIRTDKQPSTSRARYRHSVPLCVNTIIWTSVSSLLLNKFVPPSDICSSGRFLYLQRNWKKNSHISHWISKPDWGTNHREHFLSQNAKVITCLIP
jgi:hypothetical protein